MGAVARSAVVVGAGIGGLSVAGGLARAGWRVTVLERADRLRAEPTALLLWPGGVRALRALGPGAGLAAITTPVPDAGLRRPDGRWLVQPRPAAADPPLLAHAEDLHDALVAGLGDRVEVRTSVTARPVPGDGPAVTDGRRTWQADLLVAADGADSLLRTMVAPGGAVVSGGATTWRAVIPWYRAPADLALPVLSQDGRLRFRAAALGERSQTGTSGRGGVCWSLTGPGGARPEPAATQLALLHRWLADWHAPVGDLLAATDPADLVQRELRALWPPPRRLAVPAGAGAVVLLGDAGHLIADHLGLGACLAAEDAATLVAAVRTAAPGPDLHAAVAGYDRTRRSRMARVRRRTGRLGATGRTARLAVVQGRRRDRAADTAGSWHPPG